MKTKKPPKPPRTAGKTQPVVRRPLLNLKKPDIAKRAARFSRQRKARGWDDSDTWSLDHVIAKFAVPRLQRFKELMICHPGSMTMAQWEATIEDMIYGLQRSECEIGELDDQTDWKRVNRGLRAFGRWFRDLWW